MYSIQIFDYNLVSVVLLRGFRKPDFALEVRRPSDRGSNQKLSVSAARTGKNTLDKCSPILAYENALVLQSAEEAKVSTSSQTIF